MKEIADILTEEHAISRQVSQQVISWFGEVKGGRWKMDVNAVIKEVGLSILRDHKVVSSLQHTSLTFPNRSYDILFYIFYNNTPLR